MVRQEIIDAYFASTDISQSQLKLLLGPNPSIFNTQQPESELYYEEKEHFIIGDGVDTQLTGSMEDFNNKFHVSNVENKPSDKVKSIINQVFDNVKRLAIQPELIGEMRNYFPYITEACDDHQYQMNWKTPTRINMILQSHEYWEDLKASQGKTVLSQEESDKISSIVMSFRTHRHTAEYFRESREKEILYQVPIYFEYLGVRCRALLDMVVINHHHKTIQPIDIKTLGDATLYFPKSMRRRRYDIQAAFYTTAIESLEELQGVWKGYKILPFKFLVESTTYPGTPLVFTCNEDLLRIGKYGRKSKEFLMLEHDYQQYSFQPKKIPFMKFDEIKGFHNLIEDYKWYMEHGFETERRIKEAQGEFQMDWNGII